MAVCLYGQGLVRITLETISTFVIVAVIEVGLMCASVLVPTIRFGAITGIITRRRRVGQLALRLFMPGDMAERFRGLRALTFNKRASLTTLPTTRR